MFELFVADWKLIRIISISFLFEYISGGGRGLLSASGRPLSCQLVKNIDIAQASKCILMYANLISLENKLKKSQIIEYFYENHSNKNHSYKNHLNLGLADKVEGITSLFSNSNKYRWYDDVLAKNDIIRFDC